MTLAQVSIDRNPLQHGSTYRSLSSTLFCLTCLQCSGHRMMRNPTSFDIDLLKYASSRSYERSV